MPVTSSLGEVVLPAIPASMLTFAQRHSNAAHRVIQPWQNGLLTRLSICLCDQRILPCEPHVRFPCPMLTASPASFPALSRAPRLVVDDHPRHRLACPAEASHHVPLPRGGRPGDLHGHPRPSVVVVASPCCRQKPGWVSADM